MNLLALKVYDATIDLYEELCVKDCAFGGWNEEEFTRTKVLFMSASLQAKNLLSSFYEQLNGKGTEDIDVLIDFAFEKEIIWYPNCWKSMYHGLRRRIEENRTVPKDKLNIHSPRHLLPYLNNHLAAWYLVEKETGKPCSENPELFRMMKNYLGYCYSPLKNKFPGISFSEQAVIADEVYRKMYTDGFDDDYEDESVPFWHYFRPRMEALMKERGLEPFLCLSPEQMERMGIPPRRWWFEDEIERKVFTAFQDNRAIKFLYFSFENGQPVTSHVCATPTMLCPRISRITFVGENENGETHEYNMRFILFIEDEENK